MSRENPDGSKHYVQHDLEKHADLVWDLIKTRKACFYICGDANHMEKDVMAALTRIFEAKLEGSHKAATDMLEKMVATKQLQKDCWF